MFIHLINFGFWSSTSQGISVQGRPWVIGFFFAWDDIGNEEADSAWNLVALFTLQLHGVTCDTDRISLRSWSSKWFYLKFAGINELFTERNVSCHVCFFKQTCYSCIEESKPWCLVLHMRIAVVPAQKKHLVLDPAAYLMAGLRYHFWKESTSSTMFIAKEDTLSKQCVYMGRRYTLKSENHNIHIERVISEYPPFFGYTIEIQYIWYVYLYIIICQTNNMNIW